MQEAHISKDRMKELVWDLESTLTPDEEKHLGQCRECLDAFTALVLSKKNSE